MRRAARTRRSEWLWLLGGSLLAVLVSASVASLRAQATRIEPAQLPATPPGDSASDSDRVARLERLRDAAIAMPAAAGLGAALALRPRRRGTPPRSTAVVQTQIILAVIGALVMLVVGSSLARAFGVVGAAGLIRYRAKIDDPKDAGVMLSTLAVGLAAGVGLYGLSAFAALFIMGMLWIIESFEPEARKHFTLKVDTKVAAKVQPQLEDLLRRQRAKFELRTSSADELSYEVKLPMEKKTDAISKAIMELEGATAVDWNEEKKKSKDEI
jgi:Domain of unknown function (DUF4956)